jgi:mannose-6-phosphate isomerase-like protein (cupin superfamily)
MNGETMRILALALMGAVAALPAGDPAGFKMWKSADLKATQKKLASNLTAQKMASEQFGATGNHSFMIAHREANGEAELHEKVADVFVVESGEGTLVVGGKVVGGKTTAPNEIRGTSIEGGVTKKLGTGDIVHIPGNTPHQVMVDAGKQITYFVVKVTE